MACCCRGREERGGIFEEEVSRTVEKGRRGYLCLLSPGCWCRHSLTWRRDNCLAEREGVGGLCTSSCAQLADRRTYRASASSSSARKARTTRQHRMKLSRMEAFLFCWVTNPTDVPTMNRWYPLSPSAAAYPLPPRLASSNMLCVREASTFARPAAACRMRVGSIPAASCSYREDAGASRAPGPWSTARRVSIRGGRVSRPHCESRL